jgi:4,5-dihydroxyphthalate decarboxylase
MLQDEHSKGLSGEISAQEEVLPHGLTVAHGPAGMDESDLLESGEADALLHAVEPRAYVEGDPRVARLCEDYRSVERFYFESTGIFPIMHVVAMRTSLLREHAWLGRAIFDGYSSAKRLAYDVMGRLGWASDMLPWYGKELEDTRALMGDNFHSYGIRDNRSTLEALFRYSFEQDLSSRELTVEELFEPSLLDLSEDH